MKILTNILFSLILSISFANICYSQTEGQDIIIGKSYSLTSTILEEERPYQVYLPKDYDKSGEALSVMYLLDGDSHFHHTTGIVSFLRNQGKIPNMMVVAIPNTSDRTRDLTPKIEKDMEGVKRMPTAGGADKMLAFIKDELIPHIEKSYNTGTYRLLVGHSFGGIFAVHTFLEEPGLFDSFISISPSMWWDDQNLVDKAESFLSKKQDLDCFFYMTMGNENKDMLGGAMKLAALFEESDEEKLLWDFTVMDEETHGSIPHRSTYLGLVAIFKDMFTLDFQKAYSAGGLDQISNHFENLSEKFGTKMSPSENDLNNLGYAVMGKGDIAGAKSIFLKTVELFPKSFNVYDSAAEAYMNNKENEKAIKYYKKSLKINPGNTNGIEMLAKLGVKYDPKELAVKLSKKEQNKFVGEYDVSAGGVLSVEIKNGKLTMSYPAMPTQSMLYFSNNLFLTSPDNVPIKFTDDDADNVVGFEAQMGIGTTVTGKKIE